MKKTLVIHPKDDSTDFLKGIYTELPNTIVVDFSLSRKDLKIVYHFILQKKWHKLSILILLRNLK